MQAEEIPDRLPLEDVRIDVELIAGQLVHHLAPVRQAHACPKALLAERLDLHGGGQGLLREGVVTLDGDTDHGKQAGDCETEHRDDKMGKRA